MSTGVTITQVVKVLKKVCSQANPHGHQGIGCLLVWGNRTSVGKLKNNILVTICLLTNKETKEYKIAYNSKEIYIQQKAKALAVNGLFLNYPWFSATGEMNMDTNETSWVLNNCIEPVTCTNSENKRKKMFNSCSFLSLVAHSLY